MNNPHPHLNPPAARKPDLHTTLRHQAIRLVGVDDRPADSPPNTTPGAHPVGTLTVTTTELSDAIDRGDPVISIISPGDYTIDHTGRSTIHTYNDVRLHILGSGFVAAHGNSRIHHAGPGRCEAHDRSDATFTGPGLARSTGTAHITVAADVSASLLAEDDSRFDVTGDGPVSVVATGRAAGNVTGKADIDLLDDSVCFVTGKSTVRMSGRAEATIAGLAKVESAGRQNRITVLGQAFVNNRWASEATVTSSILEAI